MKTRNKPTYGTRDPRCFNCQMYAATFRFCTGEEKLMLVKALRSAWWWAHPPKTMEDM